MKRYMALCCLCIYLQLISATRLSVAIEAEKTLQAEQFLKNEARAEELPLLFGNANAFFQSIGDDFFLRISPTQMTDLIDAAIRGKWLNDLAERLSKEDLEDLLDRKDFDLLRNSMPVLERAPITRLEQLSAKGLVTLWEGTQKLGMGSLIDWSFLERFNLIRQKYYLPLVLPEMRHYFSIPTVITFLSSGQCELFTTDILLKSSPSPTESLHFYFNALCLSKLIIRRPVTLNQRFIDNLPPGALGGLASMALTKETYAHMVPNQLLEHLLSAPPTKEQILYIPRNVLEKVITTIVKSPGLIFRFRPVLLENLPDWTMALLGARFWADVNESFAWVITASQLVKLPRDAFAAISPTVLGRLIIAKHGASTSFSSHQRIGELIANLGRLDRADGRVACENPRPLLAFAHYSLLKHLQPACLAKLDPKAMTLFNDSNQLHALTREAVGRLNANQMMAIPFAAAQDSAAGFFIKVIQSAIAQYQPDMEVETVACAGLLPGHIRHLNAPSIWKSFNYECFSVLPLETIENISTKNFAYIPSHVFSMTSTIPGDKRWAQMMAKLMSTKMVAAQVEALGTRVPFEDHPCQRLVVNWPEISARPTSSIPPIYRMNPSCFALLHHECLSSMAEGSVARMADDIFEKFARDDAPSDHFGSICPEALYGIRDVQLKNIPPSVLASATVNQLQAIGKMCRYLSPLQISELDSRVLSEALSMPDKVFLPKDALAKLTSDHAGPSLELLLQGPEGVNLEACWQQLGKDLPSDGNIDNHPCSQILYEQVQISKDNKDERAKIAFWRGANTNCLRSLPFKSEVTSLELEGVADTTIAGLDEDTFEIIKSQLPQQRSRTITSIHKPDRFSPEIFAKMSLEDLEKLPTKFWVDLNPEVWAKYPVDKVPQLPLKAFALMRLESLKSAPNKFFQALTAQQWKALGSGLQGVTCAALDFHPSQDLKIPITKLSPACVSYLPDKVMTSLSQEEFNNFPDNFWEDGLSVNQIRAIPHSYWSSFTQASAVGQAWDFQSALHPCHGFRDEKIQQALRPDIKAQIETRCLKVWNLPVENKIPWLYIGIAIGALVVVGASVSLLYYCRRVSSK